MTIQLNPGEVKVLNVSLEPRLATLQGQVTNAVTGSPIAGVAVALAGPITAGVVTCSNGQYGISNIPPGNYTVTFSHPGYETVVY